MLWSVPSLFSEDFIVTVLLFSSLINFKLLYIYIHIHIYMLIYIIWNYILLYIQYTFVGTVVGVLPACLSMYHVHVWCPQKPEGRNIRSPGARVPGIHELPCGCLKSNLGYLQEQEMFLTTRSFLHSPIVYFYISTLIKMFTLLTFKSSPPIAILLVDLSTSVCLTSIFCPSFSSSFVCSWSCLTVCCDSLLSYRFRTYLFCCYHGDYLPRPPVTTISCKLTKANPQKTVFLCTSIPSWSLMSLIHLSHMVL